MSLTSVSILLLHFKVKTILHSTELGSINGSGNRGRGTQERALNIRIN